jgi:hypothetical protein
VIQRVELHGFKAFERFTLSLSESAYLAGPNNAGKSTIIAALRACAQMLRIAQRRRPTDTFDDRGSQVLGFSFSAEQVSLNDENLRHEFRDLEARISVRFAMRRTLTAVWPEPESDRDPFFYLQSAGASIHTARAATDEFPRIGIVPVLSPVEQTEAVLTSKYLRENIDGRLASRHFRNQLTLLQGAHEYEDFDAFVDFISPWIPELHMRELRTRAGRGDAKLDLFYTEPGRRTHKEIVWAGDGVQIWLQLLLHIFRLRKAEVVILDEPDVFLHPDLQRRLVRLLESLEGQTITATHSPEVLAECPPESVVWVDRVRRRSVSAPDAAALTALTASLGTQFNLRLARALRSKAVLFVEGDDMKLLRHLAETIGALRVARETDIAVVPLQGFSNWDRIEPFSWLSNELLDASVTIHAILDRDYRSEQACRSVRDRLRRIGVHAHVWKRKELESYLLEAAPISRLSGAPEEWVHNAIDSICTSMETEVFARFAFERQKAAAHDHQVQALETAKEEFAELWAQPAERAVMCPPKEVFSDLNKRLPASGFKAVSIPTIARRMKRAEIPAEVETVLLRIEDA